MRLLASSKSVIMNDEKELGHFGNEGNLKNLKFLPKTALLHKLRHWSLSRMVLMKIVVQKFLYICLNFISKRSQKAYLRKFIDKKEHW